MDRELVIFDRLLEIALLLQKDMASSFAGTGLTASRTHLLWELHQSGPSHQRSLAEAMAVSPRHVTGLVDALEASGYVTRQPDPSDRRAVLVTLTRRGVRTMRQMQAARRESAHQLVSGLGAAERASLARSLDVVAEQLGRMVTP